MEDNVVLTARGISMTFPGVKALENVDFILRKGEIHALMGENGAGKSTLIKCLTGINDFEAGEIHVDGIEGPVKNHSTRDAQNVGISTVYQEVNLCPNLSVAENLFIGREPMTKYHTIDRKACNLRSQKIMDELGIEATAEEKAKAQADEDEYMKSLPKDMQILAKSQNATGKVEEVSEAGEQKKEQQAEH